MAATRHTLILAMSLLAAFALFGCAGNADGFQAGRYTRLSRTVNSSGLDTIASRSFPVEAGENFVVRYRTEQSQGQLRLMLVRRGSALERLERVSEFKMEGAEGELHVTVDRSGTYYYELITIGFAGTFEVQTDIVTNEL
jgi:hypothetical protein